ncbi:MAG: U32 family peptidase [bacterium]
MKPELLSPAGNFEKLKVAIHYGADAVYLGGKNFSLRSFADNFNLDEIKKAITYAHSYGVKAYVTVNTFLHNNDLNNLPDYLQYLQELRVDAIIITDPALIYIAKKYAPTLPLHLSTQANSTNWQSIKFWEEHGLKRINLARELSLEEAKEIRSRVKIELECFIHGAMCISYSGRCLLSAYLTDRSANKGRCTHPCRWKYKLIEDTRPNDIFTIEEDIMGTYIMNSKDLCLIEHIPQLIEAGINSFKIEGRMKGIYYVGGVTKFYRYAIDQYIANPKDYVYNPLWLEELKNISNRGYTTGFYFDIMSAESQNYSSSSYIQQTKLVGIVKEVLGDKQFKIEIRNKFFHDDEIEILGRENVIYKDKLFEMFDEEGNKLYFAQPNQIVTIKCDYPLSKFDLIRMIKK